MVAGSASKAEEIANSRTLLTKSWPLLVTLLIGLVSLVSVAQVIGRPHLEVFYGPDLSVSGYQAPHWNNGQRPFDQLLAIDGQAVRSVADLERRVAEVERQSRHQLTVERKGKVLTWEVIARPLTIGDVGATYLPSLVFGSFFLVVGAWVAQRASSKAGRAFVSLSAILALFSFTVMEFDLTHRLWPLYFVGFCLPGSAFLALGLHLVFPQSRHQWPWWIGWSLAAVDIATFQPQGMIEATPWLFQLNHLFHYGITMAWGAAGLLGFVAILVFGWQRSPARSLQRHQLQIILPAAIVSLVPVLCVWQIALLLGEEPNASLAGFALAAVALFPMAVAVAVVQYRLFDIEVILRKALAYALAIAAISLLYGGALAGTSMWLGQSSQLQFALVIVAALLLHPIKDRLQQAIDRVFFRDRMDLPTLLQRLQRYGDVDQEALFIKMAEDLVEALRLCKAAVAIPDREGINIAYDTAQPKATAKRLPETLPAHVPCILLDRNRWSGFEAAVRIGFGEQTTAIFLLGPKLSGTPFSQADFHYVQLLLAPFSSIIAYSQAKARQRQIELEISRLYEQVAQLDQLKNSFSMVTSHELRTPLAVIVGQAEVLLDGIFGELDPQQRESIQSIQRHAQKLCQNVNDYLDLTQIQQGKLVLSCQTVDVLTALQEVLPDLAPQVACKGVTIHQYVSDLPSVAADPKRLRQVLHHLLDNAIKFSPRGGQVTVEGRTLGDQALITVRDHGEGIPENKLQSIFDTFTQVQDPLTRTHGGLGIGLPLVRGLVEAMGGDVTLVSQEGEGTAVTLRFAVAGRDPQGLENREVNRVFANRHLPRQDRE